MIMEKICTNCDFYPFCEKCEKPTGTCENWNKERLVKC